MIPDLAGDGAKTGETASCADREPSRCQGRSAPGERKAAGLRRLRPAQQGECVRLAPSLELFIAKAAARPPHSTTGGAQDRGEPES